MSTTSTGRQPHAQRAIPRRLGLLLLGAGTLGTTSAAASQLGPLGWANITCAEREGGYFCTEAKPCPASPTGEPTLAPTAAPPMPAVVNITCGPRENGYLCTETNPCSDPPPGPPIPPVVIGPDGNYPKPPEGVCPAHFEASLSRVGVSYRGRVATRTQDGLYLGYRYNFDATPRSKPPFCGHATGRRECEQWKPCQDPRGADFYMTLPGHFTNDRCDAHSNDPFWCHHKPEGARGQSGKGAQVGPTTVRAVPPGEPADSARGDSVTVDVRP
jgi:hypothetical protein